MMPLALVSMLALSTVLSAQTQVAAGSSKYGIGVQVPKSYQLTWGKLTEKDRGLGYLGAIPMEFVAPGGERVLTIEAPPGSYPGTNFGNSFFTVSVDQFLTKDECEQFPDTVPGSQKPVVKKITGIEFHGLWQGEGGMGHQWGGIYYHGFSEGSCYELGYGMATAGYGAVDGMKLVDRGEVFSILEAILEGFTVHPPEDRARPTNLPSIQTLALAPFSAHSPPNYRRLSWEVDGADPDQIWLSASCWGDLTILEVTESGKEGSVFPCDTLRPAIIPRGSLGLEFRNNAGNPTKETVRVFAAGAKSASKTRTFFLDSLPVISSIETDGRQWVSWGPQNGDFQLVSGHRVHMEGVAFLPKETLWIGSATLPVESPDGKNIDFTVPEPLAQGLYWLSLANEHGRSDRVIVRVTR